MHGIEVRCWLANIPRHGIGASQPDTTFRSKCVLFQESLTAVCSGTWTTQPYESALLVAARFLNWGFPRGRPTGSHGVESLSMGTESHRISRTRSKLMGCSAGFPSASAYLVHSRVDMAEFRMLMLPGTN